MIRTFRKAPLVSLLAMALYGSHSLAQELVLEEILVTAQKRTESVQDIPSTVNVLGEDMLKDFNVQSLTDLENLTAGLQIDSLTGRSGRMFMRGIAHNPNSAAEAAVTVYWNQAIVDGNAIYQKMFDVQRVEVLRGPQGTLTGRTSPAGAINIHTARPNLESTEGEIRVTAMDNDGLNTQIAASFPVIPGQLALRFAGVYDESDLDEIENDLTGDISGEETTAGRFSLSWLPTDNVSVDFAVQYLERDLDDLTTIDGMPTGNPILDPEGELRELDTFDRRDARVGLGDIMDNTDADFFNSSLVLNWDLASHTITSVTGYHETESAREFDQAQGNANPDNVTRRIASDDRTDWSQELRIANNEGEVWEYMVGAYYENADILFTQENFPPPFSPFFGGSFLLLFPADVERWGLFTHNKFYLSDKWSLQLGLRYQEYENERDMKTVAGENGVAILEPGELIDQVLSDDNQLYEDDSTTGQLSLQYQFSDDANIYGLVATGWRAGGITVTGSLLPEDILLFDPEDSISYELGFKSTLMDGAIRFNGALFYQDFDDYISRIAGINVRESDGSIGFTGATVNGDAEVWGAELDATAILSQNWYLGGALSYTDGEFADGTTLPCNDFDANGVPIIPEGQAAATCDVSGDPIGRAADWTASINTEYSIPFDSFEGYGRLLYAYTGEQYTPDLGYLDTYQTVDMFLGVRAERWSVEVFARNLFDEEALVTGSGATPLVRRQPTGYAMRWPVPARRIGLTASYRW